MTPRYKGDFAVSLTKVLSFLSNKITYLKVVTLLYNIMLLSDPQVTVTAVALKALA